MGISAPPALSTYYRDQLQQREDELNQWVSGNIIQIANHIDRIEIALKANQEVMSDLQEKLDMLLKAVAEEIEPIKNSAPKTMRIAAELSLENMDDKVE